MISLEDAGILMEHGVAVIDCSWAFFDSVKVRSIRQRERILPNLLAANTINYGKEFKLNCAEALAAAYYLCGFEAEARSIMSHFKYGAAFFAVNEYRFSRYKGCATSEEMKQREAEVLEELRVEKQERREIEMPSSDSDDSEEQAYLQSIRDLHKQQQDDEVVGAAAQESGEESDRADSDQDREGSVEQADEEQKVDTASESAATAAV
eukprot:Macronucleus_3742.p1 GENE.Macronucleus_3742~~Macronucleus_3742.p1  ORF type:complete len:208 (+),score=5.14 Macronucleus_3742:1-624(+)